jgi:hypothetical protein
VRPLSAPAEIVPADEAIDLVKQHVPQLVVLDRMDLVCSKNQQECFSLDDRLNKFFDDYGHNTLVGADFFGRRLDEVDWPREVDREVAARVAQ